jgi:hypothetical protein
MKKPENDGIDTGPWLIDPVRLVLLMSGRVPPVPLERVDCDEQATFLLGLALMVKVPAELVTVAADPTRPGQFSHVYLRCVHIAGTRTPYDLTSRPYAAEPSQIFRRRVWPVDVPIDPWSYAEPDRATAKTVAAMIAAGRASTSHPEFRAFLRRLAGVFGHVFSGMISQEEWRRSEAGQEFLRSVPPSENSGNAFLRELSGEDLQSLKAWAIRFQTELQHTDTDVRQLLESLPAISIPEPADAQLSEFPREVVDTLAAWLAEFSPARKRPRQDS